MKNAFKVPLLITWLLIGGIILLVKGFDLNLLFVWTTTVLLFWYSLETAGLRKISEATNAEMVKQTDLQSRPYLLLKWKDKAVIRQMFAGIPGSDPPGEKTKRYTGIEIVNIGRGLAKDVDFVEVIVQTAGHKEEIPLKSITAIGSEQALQVSYGHVPAYSTPLEGRSHLLGADGSSINIYLSYQDASGGFYEAHFVSNDNYQDGFAIVKQDRGFSGISDKKFKVLKRLWELGS